MEEQGTGRRALEGITWFGGVSLKAGGQLEPRCQASHMVVTAHSLPQATLNRIFTTQLNIFLRVGEGFRFLRLGVGIKSRGLCKVWAGNIKLFMAYTRTFNKALIEVVCVSMGSVLSLLIL